MRLAGAGDRVAAHRVDVEREADLARARPLPRRPRSSGTPVRMKFCWRVRRMSPPKRVGELGDRDHLVAGDQPEVHRDADRRRAPSCFWAWTPRWWEGSTVIGGERVVARACGRGGPRRARACPRAPMSSTMNLRRAFTRETRYLRSSDQTRGDRAEDLVRLLLRDEDAHVARDPRHRREPAADEHGEAFAAVVDRADQRDAVDLGRVAAIGAGRDRVLVLARQVRPSRGCRRRGRRQLRRRSGVAVEELVRRRAPAPGSR